MDIKRIVCIGVSVLWPLSAFAAEGKAPLANRFNLNLGAQIVADFDSEARVDSPTLGRGTQINFEHTLGLEDSGTFFRLDGQYRFAKRHRINFSFFDIARDASAVIGQQIQFEDQIFPANARVESELDTRILKFSYGFSMFYTDSADVGLSVGVHAMTIDTELRTADFTVRSDADVTAPLPVFGLHGSYTLIPRLHLGTSAEFFVIDLDEVEGSLRDIRITLEHDTFEHLGFGIGYNDFDMALELDDTDDFDGEANYAYRGCCFI